MEKGKVAEKVTQFEHYLSEKRGLSYESVRAYTGDVEWLIKEFAIEDPSGIPNLPSANIQSALTEFSPGTQRRRIAGLRSFTEFLSGEGIPCHFFLQTPKDNEFIPDYVSPQTYYQMRSHRFKFCTVRNLALLDLMYGNGLKFKTLKTLHWNNVDLPQRCLKGLDRYSIDLPLTDESQKSLRNHQEIMRPQNSESLCFLNRFEDPLESRTLGKIVVAYGKSVDLEVSPLNLRWSYFVNLTNRGGDLEEAIDLMGYTCKNPARRSARNYQLRRKLEKFKASQQTV